MEERDGIYSIIFDHLVQNYLLYCYTTADLAPKAVKIEMSRVPVQRIQTTIVSMRELPLIRPVTTVLRPVLQLHGSDIFANPACVISSITKQRRTIHCSMAVGANDESESVTKDLKEKDATKPYNEGHGSASPDEIVDTEAAFDSDSVDPKEEMKEAGDKLNVSGANEKASPTPGHDD